MDNTPGVLSSIASRLSASSDQLLEKHFYQEEQKMRAAAFLEQFNYAVCVRIHTCGSPPGDPQRHVDRGVRGAGLPRPSHGRTRQRRPRELVDPKRETR